jgi:hypothetical protein
MPDLPEIRSAPIGPTNIGALRVTRALAAIRLVGDGALTELHVSVSDFVRVQRALGTTPEVLLAQLKQLVARAMPADEPFELRQAVTTRVVEWAIGAYYTSSHDVPTTERSSLELRD